MIAVRLRWDVLKAVFFDNDGVLVDTEGLYYRVTRDQPWLPACAASSSRAG